LKINKNLHNQYGGQKMRLLTLLSGAVFIIAGTFCFANPGATILSIAFVLGVTMIFFGACGILTYVINRKAHETSGWILEETILTTILGMIVLTNRVVTDDIIPIFFGMWIMFAGIMRIVEATTLRVKGSKVWSFSLSFGILSVIAGIYAFLNPISNMISLPALIGVFFIIQGLNTIANGVHMIKEDKLDEKE
jgi:uncharacterized membrane protein HdeD (DUF308 family)